MSLVLDAPFLLRSPLLRLALGVQIIEAPLVPIGRPVRFVGDGNIYAHPLDIIGLRNTNPHDRLDEAITWVAGQAADRFDRASARLEEDGGHDRLVIALHDYQRGPVPEWRAVVDFRDLARQSELWRSYVEARASGALGAVLYASHVGAGVAVDVGMPREPWHSTFPLAARETEPTDAP